MKTKFNQFINESRVPPYVSLKSNLYNFFENLGIESQILEEKQLITIELDFQITGKEDWFESFIELCDSESYDKHYIENNTIGVYRSLGLWSQPNQYTQFDD